MVHKETHDDLEAVLEGARGTLASIAFVITDGDGYVGTMLDEVVSAMNDLQGARGENMVRFMVGGWGSKPPLDPFGRPVL